MEKIKHYSLVAILFALSISCFVTNSFALDPIAPNPVRVGVIVPPGVKLFDGQDYTVNKVDSQAQAKFKAAGWAGGKICNNAEGAVYPPSSYYCRPTGNCTEPGECGGNIFFYTVTSTPGINRTIPGNGRALCIEGWEGTLNGQSDAFLQYGVPSNSVGHVPADVWFQFWILLETDPNWRFRSNSNIKFIYPSKTGGGTCDDISKCDWMWLLGNTSYIPDLVTSSNGTAYFTNYTSHNPQMEYGTTGQCYGDDLRGKPGQVNTTYGPLPGEWYLIRLHANTSQAAITNNRQLIEAYARKYNDSTFTIIERWQQGQDYSPAPGGGCTFNYIINTSLGYGHNAFRLITTMARYGSSYYNTRFYIKDFSMAAGTDSGGNGMNDLPRYPDY